MSYFPPRYFPPRYFAPRYWIQATVLTVWTVAGSGGVATVGNAATSYTQAGLNSWTVTGTGGTAASGAAERAKTIVRSASGGVIVGGAGAVSRTKVPATGGGVITSGTVAISRSNAAVGAGGVAAGGTAAVAKVRTLSGAGGVVTSGSGSLVRIKGVIPSGGIITSGAATTEFRVLGSNQNIYTGTGGMQAGGAALAARDQASLDLFVFWTGVVETDTDWIGTWSIEETWTASLEDSMSAKAKKLELTAGDFRLITLSVQDSQKQPVDLTAFIVDWTLYQGSDDVALSKRTGIAGEIALLDQGADTGKCRFELRSTDTISLMPSSYHHVTRLTDPSGRSSVVLEGELVIEPVWS